MFVFFLTGCNKTNTVNFFASPFYNKSISSQNYPSPYADNADCSWLIQSDNLRNPNYIVKVLFNDFDLNYSRHSSMPDRCPYDYLKFYDGQSTSDNLLGIYCSTFHPDVIYSTGQYMYVKFHTDRSGAPRGFNFSFSAVNKGIFAILT